ncbi:MAG: phage tail protein [Lachnospiraceae bacterium]|nr:phage tail protein [Lachnospiraceae bacterium]
MSQNTITTITGRQKMMRARAGDIELPKIVGVAFGDGGVNEAGEVIEPQTGQTALNHELMRKAASGYEFIGTTTCRYSVTLLGDELAGEYISEIGLYDEDGDLVCIKTFTKKGKEADIEQTYNIDDIF